MRICVVGAGGVGGLLAAVLRRADVDVGVLVTERHLAPIRRDGLTVIGPGGRWSARGVPRHSLPRWAESSCFPC